MKIGIIGSLGMVGSNLYNYFTLKGYDVVGFDKADENGDINDVLDAHILFLCLPTPYIKGQKGYDLTAIKQTLPLIPDHKIVVIKSTILPGTTDKLQKKFPNLKLMFVPEFLTERFAWEDTLKPETNVIGYTEQSYGVAREVLRVLPEAPLERIIPAKDAEMVKIARNNYFVNKIVFANTLYDICEKHGIDYKNVKECFAADRRIRRSHLEIFHNGSRGGGGTCFPKDSCAYRDFVSKSLPRSMADKFVKTYVDINMKILKKSGKDKGKQFYDKKL